MKKYKVRFTPDAFGTIAHLQPAIKKLIRSSIDLLRVDPFKGDELQRELAGFRSLKPKQYRIIYKVNSDESYIEIFYVGLRKDVYENFRLLLQKLRSET